MKNNILCYQGYHTTIEFDAEDCVLRGKIDGISDLVTFESEDLKNIESEFHNAVDDYIAFCQQVRKEPEKEYKGAFNVRINPDLHKKMAMYSIKNDISLNHAVETAISEFVNGNEQKKLRQSIESLNEKINNSSIYVSTRKPGNNTIMAYQLNYGSHSFS